MSVVDGQIANAATFNSAFGSKQADNTFQGKQTLARPGSGATILDAQQALNDVIASDALKIPLAEKGAANGVAPLDASTLIDPVYLPSVVFNVVEVATAALLPVTGESEKIYITADTDYTYRWNGIAYVFLARPIVDTDDVPEGANLYFTNQRAVEAYDTSQSNNSSGSDITLATPTAGLVEIINPLIVSIEGITAPSFAQKFVLVNKSGVPVVIKNDSGVTAANRILTGSGGNLTIETDSMFLFAYSPISSRWYISGGTGSQYELIKEIPVGAVNGVNATFTFSEVAVGEDSVWVFVNGLSRIAGYTFTQGVTESSITFTSDIPVTGQEIFVQYFKQPAGITPPAPSGGGALEVSGSVGSPNIITAAGGISITSDQRQYQFVVSNGGAVTVTANPQIIGGTIIGQELILEGTSDLDYPILNDGTGLSLNGAVSLQNRKKIYLVWNGFDWSEVSRT